MCQKIKIREDFAKMSIGNSYITTDKSFILECLNGEGKERSMLKEKWDKHIIWEERNKGRVQITKAKSLRNNDVLGEIDLEVKELAWFLAYN